MSPTPMGTLQADFYRQFRFPTILVGDSKLGGIGATISAFESLHVRGYDVDNVMLFYDPEWKNHEYLKNHFKEYGVSVHLMPLPPRRSTSTADDERAMLEYYEKFSQSEVMGKILDHLNYKHFLRVSKLSSLPSKAESVIWHPFRQHALPQNVVAIDSAYWDHFQAYDQETDPLFTQAPSQTTSSASPDTSFRGDQMLTSLFDASASWWTQGLGHGNSRLALTAANAAGRYGHVMFANAVHEPALDLCYNLLETLENPRLSRIFFTDNGSTGMEVAVKMALRASCQRYGWKKDDAQHPVGVLGLKGSYHGDTIGVMNCSEPNTFNEKVDWYRPWGFWFDPPQVSMRKGRWEIEVPSSMNDDASAPAASTLTFDTLTSIFDHHSRPEDAAKYRSYISRTLKRLTHDQHRRFGALIIEPVLMGAGGMIFVDPLFQRTLITTIRENPSLINPSYIASITQARLEDAAEWAGLPLIADEVFTGLYRLGRPSSSSFLSSQHPDQASLKLSHDVAPDISVHAKLLTGGLLPLALTTASNSIFNTFLSPSKSDALLHGHSYTAHPIGCAVANHSLKEMKSWYTNSSIWDEHRAQWCPAPGATSTLPVGPEAEAAVRETASATKPPKEDAPSEPTLSLRPDKDPPTELPNDSAFSFFSPTFLTTLSHHPLVSGCFALGSVLAFTMKPTPSPSPSLSPSPLSPTPLSPFTPPPFSDPAPVTSSSPSSTAPESTFNVDSAFPSISSTKGYNSTAASSLQQRLMTTLSPSNSGIHARTLGDVLYIMTSLITSPKAVRQLEKKLMIALNTELKEREGGHDPYPEATEPDA